MVWLVLVVWKRAMFGFVVKQDFRLVIVLCDFAGLGGLRVLGF